MVAMILAGGGIEENSTGSHWSTIVTKFLMTHNETVRIVSIMLVISLKSSQER